MDNCGNSEVVNKFLSKTEELVKSVLLSVQNVVHSETALTSQLTRSKDEAQVQTERDQTQTEEEDEDGTEIQEKHLTTFLLETEEKMLAHIHLKKVLLVFVKIVLCVHNCIKILMCM